MTFTSEQVKIVYLQEVQVFRVFVPWEEERGLSEPRPQVLCFITKFGKNEFISSDAMSKLRQVIIPAFFFRKKGYINFVPKSVRRPSVCASVRLCVRASVTFLVNVSPPKRLDVATSNFVAE